MEGRGHPSRDLASVAHRTAQTHTERPEQWLSDGALVCGTGVYGTGLVGVLTGSGGCRPATRLWRAAPRWYNIGEILIMAEMLCVSVEQYGPIVFRRLFVDQHWNTILWCGIVLGCAFICQQNGGTYLI